MTFKITSQEKRFILRYRTQAQTSYDKMESIGKDIFRQLKKRGFNSGPGYSDEFNKLVPSVNVEVSSSGEVAIRPTIEQIMYNLTGRHLRFKWDADNDGYSASSSFYQDYSGYPINLSFGGYYDTYQDKTILYFDITYTG